MQSTHGVDLAAGRAFGGHHRDIGAEQVGKQTGNGVAVQHEVVRRDVCGHAYVPVGPKRSVRICDGARPMRTRAFAADSTRAVGPQM